MLKKDCCIHVKLLLDFCILLHGLPGKMNHCFASEHLQTKRRIRLTSLFRSISQTTVALDRQFPKYISLIYTQQQQQIVGIFLLWHEAPEYEGRKWFLTHTAFRKKIGSGR